ncbi:hypothetical protein K413DRAFT_0897 [Clostridium sp. ASBs410]|nr:hypothetical protein K413DRAFT_0897 [Clostridium sp. ASBs410]
MNAIENKEVNHILRVKDWCMETRTGCLPAWRKAFDQP